MTADPQDSQSTQSLLLHAQAGDEEASGRLLERYRRPLNRWARGRLPGFARGVLETEDLVQVALASAASRVSDLRTADPNVFHGYLRRCILNGITDEVRKARSKDHTLVDSHLPDTAPSAMEELVGRQTLERYERALDRLTDSERAAVHARVELGLSYRDVALALDKPTADAARMAVSRAIAKLATEMARDASQT